MRALRFILPVLVLATGLGAAALLMATGPKTERRQPPPVVPVVDVVTVAATDFQIRARTRGTVSPRTESTLIPEVSGRVIEIAPQPMDFAERDMRVGIVTVQLDVADAGCPLIGLVGWMLLWSSRLETPSPRSSIACQSGTSPPSPTIAAPSGS